MNLLGAVVIGAGQAGLAASYHLASRGIDHVVLERDRVGATWLTQRWDSFALNTPGWRSHLRVDDPERRADDDAFLSASAFVGRLEAFAARHALSARAGVEVTGIAQLVGSVIWATGFGGAFGYLPPGALDERGLQAHDLGVGAIAGIFAIGFRWLSRRKSGIIPGVDQDAERIVELVARRKPRMPADRIVLVTGRTGSPHRSGQMRPAVSCGRCVTDAAAAGGRRR